jgi:ATP-dependent protease ClpP protease subunit
MVSCGRLRLTRISEGARGTSDLQRCGGHATDVEIAARDLIATWRMLAGICEKTTKKPIEQILKDIDRDYYMTAEEARDYGLVDQIFSKEMRTGQTALT